MLLPSFGRLRTDRSISVTTVMDLSLCLHSALTLLAG